MRRIQLDFGMSFDFDRALVHASRDTTLKHKAFARFLKEVLWPNSWSVDFSLWSFFFNFEPEHLGKFSCQFWNHTQNG